MNTLRLKILSAMIASCFLAATNKGQETGKIIGTVIDENGSPVAGAKITTDLDGSGMHSLIKYVDSDTAGRFVVAPLAFGTYKVFAKNEDLGYPDSRWSFYSGGIFSRASVSHANPTVEVRVKIGPRAGVLTGSVSDASNGAPIGASFKLWRANAPNDWISTSVPSSYRVLLPPATPVRIEVSAPGFTTWASRDPLSLQSGAVLRLDIALQPSHDPSLHPSKFLVPEGYVGWLLLEYEVASAEPVPIEAGEAVFKFPANGLAKTSSAGPQRGAHDVYLYYSQDGSLRPIPTDYRNGNLMIWGQYEGTRGGVLSQFGFFVGSEEQYKKYQSQATHPGPIPVR